MKIRTLGLAALVAALPVAASAAQEIPLPANPAPSSAHAARPLYTGVEIIPVDEPTRTLFKLPETAGMLVIGVNPGSPADGKIGQGDILLKINGKSILNRQQLRSLIRTGKEGDTAKFTLMRGGQTRTVEVKLAAIPDALAFRPSPDPRMPQGMTDAEELMRQITERMRRDMVRAGVNVGDAEDNIRITVPDLPGASVHFTKIRRMKNAEGTVTLTENNGANTALVKDSDGKELYRGAYSETDPKIPEWAHRAIRDGAGSAVSIGGGISGNISISSGEAPPEEPEKTSPEEKK